MKTKTDLALFYLARRNEGIKSFRRFIESYKRNRPGCDHKLVVIYKGFENTKDLHEAKKAFSSLSHEAVLVNDTHFDIGAYLEASACIQSEYVCFVNTHTEVLAQDWLLHLRTAMDVDNIGMAGATASFESLYDSLALTSKVVWLASNNLIPYESETAEYYKYLLEMHCPTWWTRKNRRHVPRTIGVQTHRMIDERWDETWRGHISPNGVFEFLYGFPRFPNPHIRSNGFILRRDLLLEFFSDLPPTKKAAYSFESGPDSLSARIVRRGLKLAMVSKDGRVRLSENWMACKGFRLGDQSDLLLGDNQTRGFLGYSEPEQLTHVLMSWGEAACQPRGACPLRFVFDPNSSPRAGTGEGSLPGHIIDHSYYGIPMVA